MQIFELTIRKEKFVMKITEIITAIKELVNLFSSANVIEKGFILLLLLCILIPVLSIVIPKLNSKIDTQDPIFLYFRTKAKRRNDRNEKELELYADLNEYVLPIKNIKELPPVEAANFKSTINDIIGERKLYITNFLEDCLFNLDYYLDTQDPDYTITLVQIRSHIMREYQSLRKSLGYPTISIFNRLYNYGQTWELSIYYSSIFLILFCVFAAISVLLLPFLSINPTVLNYIQIIFLLISFVFFIFGVIWLLLFFITFLFYKANSKKQKKKLFGNTSLPKSKKKK